MKFIPPYNFTHSVTPNGHLFTIAGLDIQTQEKIRRFVSNDMNGATVTDQIVDWKIRDLTSGSLDTVPCVTLRVEFDNDEAATTFQLFWENRQS
jgi:hypothetical protein